MVAALADDHRAQDGDLAGLVAALRSGRAAGARRWRSEVARLERLAQGSGASGTGGSPAADAARPATRVPSSDVAGLVTALAHPSRVARRDGATWLLASGTRAALPPGSPLQSFDWVAVADVTRAGGRAAAGTGAVIRLAAGLGQDGVDLATGALRTREVRATFVDGRVVAREVEAIGAIELAATPVRPSPEAGARAVADALARDGLGILGWSAPADSLRRRMALLHRVLGGHPLEQLGQLSDLTDESERE